MMQLKEVIKRSPFGTAHDEHYYQDDEENQYGRISGGFMAATETEPGAIVVIAESRKKDEVLDRKTYRVLLSYESLSPHKLLEQAAAYRRSLFVKAYFTDMDNLAAVKEVRKSKLAIQLRRAPMSCDTNAAQFYINMLRGLLQPGEEILTLNTKTRTLLKGVDANRAKQIMELPLFAALAYCISGLTTYRDDRSEDLRVRQMTEEHFSLYNS